jgi:hypothetical protein
MSKRMTNEFATLVAVLWLATGCYQSSTPACDARQPAANAVPPASANPMANAVPQTNAEPTASAVEPQTAEQATPTPGSADSIEVSLHNNCAKPAAVFWGELPNKSVGFAYTLGPSESRKPLVPLGTKVWLLGRDGQGISQATCTRGTTTVEIQDSCTTIAAR